MLAASVLPIGESLWPDRQTDTHQTYAYTLSAEIGQR